MVRLKLSDVIYNVQPIKYPHTPVEHFPVGSRYTVIVYAWCFQIQVLFIRCPRNLSMIEKTRAVFSALVSKNIFKKCISRPLGLNLIKLWVPFLEYWFWSLNMNILGASRGSILWKPRQGLGLWIPPVQDFTASCSKVQFRMKFLYLGLCSKKAKPPFFCWCPELW